jgi:uncharacterized protein (DUF1697 family)
MPGTAPTPIRCVALLRGVNVGRAKRVSMKDLRDVVTRLGARDVVTLLNSGNVVFTLPSAAEHRDFAARIERALMTDLGLSSRVTVLVAAELDRIVAEQPLAQVDNPSRLVVTVTTRAADLSRLQPLLSRDWGRSRLAVGSRAAYAWCPDGISASELPVAMGNVLGDGATARNWATMRKLQVLAGS